jgi:hypothetical protein
MPGGRNDVGAPVAAATAATLPWELTNTWSTPRSVARWLRQLATSWAQISSMMQTTRRPISRRWRTAARLSRSRGYMTCTITSS